MKRIFEGLKRTSRGRVSAAVVVTCVAFIASGCATPIGVIRVNPRTAQHDLTANALVTDKSSSLPGNCSI